jgi:hypothetical protein
LELSKKGVSCNKRPCSEVPPAPSKLGDYELKGKMTAADGKKALIKAG